jgi:dipeptidyl aminopeptidase/acylaminoacyl peptidase
MEVWVAETNGGDAVQLTSMGAQTTTPRWSQDGQLIAFQSNREGQFDIYVVPGTGGRPHNLTSHPANDHAPSFSRDGQWVYFSSTRTGNYRIWKIPVRGGEAVQVTDAGFRAIEGTDGKDIYYSVGTLGDTATLWRTSTVGGPAVKVLNGVVHDAFAIIDTGIYFVDRDGSEARLQYYDFVTRRSVTVTRGLGDIRPFITASPEGRVILVSRVDSALQDLMLVENFR